MTTATLEAHLGYWLRLVSNQVTAAFARRLQTEGVTVPQWVALRLIEAHGAVAPGRLAEEIGLTRGAVSKIVDRLEAHKLASQCEQAGDGRGRLLRLTPQGRRLIPQLAALAEANEREAFGGLAPAERDTLAALLQKTARHNGWSALPVD
jgi:DNA-binding MarR family transcriptional regulator